MFARYIIALILMLISNAVYANITEPIYGEWKVTKSERDIKIEGIEEFSPKQIRSFRSNILIIKRDRLEWKMKSIDIATTDVCYEPKIEIYTVNQFMFRCLRLGLGKYFTKNDLFGVDQSSSTSGRWNFEILNKNQIKLYWGQNIILHLVRIKT